MPRKVKITEARFEIFKKEFRFWQDFFNLKDWSVNLVKGKLKNRDNLAEVRWEDDVLNARMVGIILCDYNSADDNELREAAFHEACELIFVPLRVMAAKAGAHEGEVDKEVHRITMVLLNSIFREMGRNV